MNVNDAEAPEVTKDRLEMMFDRQRELAKKYHEIEIATGVGYGMLRGIFDIDTHRGQALCKCFAWRVTEEIVEATECPHDPVHAKEEAADALHFLIELYLINDIEPEEVSSGYPYSEETDMLGVFFESDHLTPLHVYDHIGNAAYGLIETLGKAMNCLKQKPWKQTQMLTDIVKFRRLLCEAFEDWVTFARSLGMDAQEAFEFYFKKSEVNIFRQRSNY